MMNRFTLRMIASFFCFQLIVFPCQSVLITEKQKQDANAIIDYFTKGQGKGQTYQWLARFSDLHPTRHTPTKGFDDAANDLLKELKTVGFDRVWTEEAPGIPNWFRGGEQGSDNPDQAVLLKPRRHVVPVFALGNSTAINVKTAHAIVVQSFDELAAVPDNRVKGAVVVFNQPWLGSYELSVDYRENGATEAAKRGAIAALIRSITPFSIYTLHTGATRYSSDPKLQIPTGSITVEDAELLWRLQNAGHELELSLDINTAYYGEITKNNLIAEIRGSTHPDELVVFGGHLDAWDAGTGAMDDGGGIAVTLHTLLAVKALGLRPKRTLRGVFWTAEEIGYQGSDAYFQAHKNESSKMALAMESDSGTFKPLGFHFGGNAEARRALQDVLNLMAPINATQLVTDGELPAEQEAFYHYDGVPVVEMMTAEEKYFWYHHTYADTMTMMNSDDLDGCAALFATTAYIVADLDELLPHGK